MVPPARQSLSNSVWTSLPLHPSLFLYSDDAFLDNDISILPAFTSLNNGETFLGALENHKTENSDNSAATQPLSFG
jgi:hypothetical protein